MECGKNKAVYNWEKDGTLFIAIGPRILTVTNETRDPFGVYTCTTDGVRRQWYLPMQSSEGIYRRYAWGVGRGS